MRIVVIMDRNSNRCANTEALHRYEREMDANERAYDERESCMFVELDEHIEAIQAILEMYEMQDNGMEYVKDRI